MECPQCGEKKFTKSGLSWRGGKRIQRYLCKGCGRITTKPKEVEIVEAIHGWNIESKSLTACGLNWIYGRAKVGKQPLQMVDGFTDTSVTCKRCLKSKKLRIDT